MQSILEILNKTVAYFQSKGVPDAKLDAQLLLAHVMQCKRLELFLHFEDPVLPEKLDVFREMVRRRAKREPLQHILGTTDFFGITLNCDARALIPRPETEYLCELLVEKYICKDAQAEFSVLELGVGTGAISLALKNHFPNAKIVGVDVSSKALELAKENANKLNLDVEFLQSDWFENVSGKFDLIVSNPPYLSDSEVESAEPEVKDFDPINALRSDDNGIADLRKILEQAPNYLNNNGFIACECGVNQPEILAEEFSAKYKKIESVNDMSQRSRYVFASV